jgi:hypothetical protein
LREQAERRSLIAGVATEIIVQHPPSPARQTAFIKDRGRRAVGFQRVPKRRPSADSCRLAS